MPFPTPSKTSRWFLDSTRRGVSLCSYTPRCHEQSADLEALLRLAMLVRGRRRHGAAGRARAPENRLLHEPRILPRKRGARVRRIHQRAPKTLRGLAAFLHTARPRPKRTGPRCDGAVVLEPLLIDREHACDPLHLRHPQVLGAPCLREHRRSGGGSASNDVERGLAVFIHTTRPRPKRMCPSPAVQRPGPFDWLCACPRAASS